MINYGTVESIEVWDRETTSREGHYVQFTVIKGKF